MYRINDSVEVFLNGQWVRTTVLIDNYTCNDGLKLVVQDDAGTTYCVAETPSEVRPAAAA